MNEYLLAALIVLGLLTALAIASMIISALENIRIARCTGTDPRSAKVARRATDHTPTWVSDTPDRG